MPIKCIHYIRYKIMSFFTSRIWYHAIHILWLKSWMRWEYVVFSNRIWLLLVIILFSCNTLPLQYVCNCALFCSWKIMKYVVFYEIARDLHHGWENKSLTLKRLLEFWEVISWEIILPYNRKAYTFDLISVPNWCNAFT